MDPLSISTGVLTLLTTCISVTIELKKLKSGSSDARTTTNAMLSDINGLRTVLQSMESTFEEIEVQDGFQTTGHIGAHWQNLNESLHDGYESLAELEALLKSLNRNVTILDGPRRYARLQAAASQITSHRQQVQAYRDALQFSIQTIDFWNSVCIKNNTDKMLTRFETVDQNLDRLASNLEVKLQALLSLFSGSEQRPRKEAMQRLSVFVKSAATTYSSTSASLQEPSVTGQLLEDFVHQEPTSDLELWVGSQQAVPLSTDLVPSPQSTPYQNEPARSPLIDNADFDWFVFDNDVSAAKPNTFPIDDPRLEFKAEKPQSPKPLEVSSPSKPRRSWLRRSSRAALSSDSPIENFPNKTARLALTKPPSNTLSKSPGRTKKRYQDVQRKFVLVGDGAAGKTSFIIRATRGTMPEVYVPTVFENYVYDFQLDGRTVHLSLWDTAGQEDYDRLRPLSYKDVDVACICAPICSPASFYNVEEKWAPELRHHCPTVPLILIGCMEDLRDDPETIGKLLKSSQTMITYTEGQALASRIGAIGYFECSAKTGKGIEETLEALVRTSIENREASEPRKRSGIRRLFRIA